MAMLLRRDCPIVERSQVLMRLNAEKDLSANAVVTGWQDAMRRSPDTNGKRELLQFFIVPIRVLGLRNVSLRNVGPQLSPTAQLAQRSSLPPSSAEKCGNGDRYTSKASRKNLSLQSENSGKPGTSLLRCIAFCV